MNFDDKELTLLSEEEIYGIHSGQQLDVLNKYGTIAAITDLAILTGGYCEDSRNYTAPDDNSLKGRTGWFYTRSLNGFGYVWGVGFNGFTDKFYPYLRNCTIRPVIQLSESIFNEITKNSVKEYNGTKKVLYGEYPQYVPDLDVQARLNDEYQRGNLRPTGGDYTFDMTKYNNYRQNFQPVKYEEYEYNGKKYIHVKANSDYGKSSFKLSNGELYRNGDYVWVEVSPVVWLIDDMSKKLISKRGLVSGIRFHAKKRIYHRDFKNTEMKWFLDNHMIHDLFQSTISEKVNNGIRIKNEIINLVKEIKEYMKYYHGDIDIKSRVNDIIQNYNEKLTHMKTSCGSNNLELTIESQNADTIRRNLVSDLENILLELKSYSANIKSYYDMIDILKECCNRMCDIDINKDELCDMVYSIKSIIFKSIINDEIRNSLISELDEILEKSIKENLECIRNFENLSVKYECIKTIDELKLEFRKIIHPYLIKLNGTVLKQDVVNEVMNNIILIISNNYQETKNKQIKYFLDIIQTIVVNIRKHGNLEDLDKINELLTFEIDYHKDIVEILKDLNKIIIRAYRFEFDILERNNRIRELNSCMIEFNVYEMFNDEKQNNVLNKTL